MILASIINIWDGVELLQYAVRSTASDVQLFVIVYQTESNFGEKYDPYPEIEAVTEMFPHKKFVSVRYDVLIYGGTENEKNKRNLGIQIARQYGATHFLFQDADEVYENFTEAVKAYENAQKDGSVCRIITYFRFPILRFENPDNYFVPFIHKLNSETRAGTSNYPFYVDPTRSVNCENIAELDIFMHHFSWIRNNIDRKIRNSSARDNINRTKIRQDYELASPGYYVEDIFKQKLVEVPNKFNINI